MQRRTGTILVVEDDRDVRDAIVDTLEHEGYRVVSAVGGAEALTALAAEPFDLILLDLMMPGMDGWEFLERAFRDRESTRTPVVVMTAMPFEIQTSPLVRAVIPKPFESGGLLRVVHETIRPRT